MEQIPTVILKNGATEAEPLVNTIMYALKCLFDEKPVAFLELVTKCRDGSHQWFGSAEQICKDYTLIPSDGRIHDSIKNIVLSAIEGEGLGMVLGSPLKSQPEKEKP